MKARAERAAALANGAQARFRDGALERRQTIAYLQTFAAESRRKLQTPAKAKAKDRGRGSQEDGKEEGKEEAKEEGEKGGKGRGWGEGKG